MEPTIVHAHGEAAFIRAALDRPVPAVITLHSIFAQQTPRAAYALMRQGGASTCPEFAISSR